MLSTLSNAVAELLRSASKVVFIMMAIGVHAALFANKITGSDYMVLATAAFTFYFSNKGSKETDFLGK